MPNLLVRMSDEQHKRLEAFRASRGLRSLNAAMLTLIDQAGSGTAAPVAKALASPLPPMGGKLVLPKRFTMDDVRPKFEPRQKPDKGAKR